MALIDVIKYEGGNNVLVWKHPREDFNTSTQLIVHESQEAVVFKDGIAHDPYSAGKHTIETENIPGIRRLVGLVTGGVSPNHCEVYFINKAYALDVHWGTASEWKLQDPTLQVPFSMQARGQFAVRVTDSKQFLNKMVGTTSSFTTMTLQNYFSDLMISRIKDCISNIILSEGLSHTEISSRLVSIGEKVTPMLSGTLEKYGLSLEEFVVEGVSIKNSKISEAIEEAQKDRAVNIIKGITEQDKMAHDVALAQASNPGMGGQASQIMTGVAAGAAMAPAMGHMVRNVMQPAEQFGQSAIPHRDQFSMGVVNKRTAPVEEDKAICPQCGVTLVKGSRFCNQCGAQLEKESETPETCPLCGGQLPKGSRFCNHCGGKI